MMYNKINMTGTVIDCGDGMTQITSIVDGFIIGSSLSIIPITGKSITSYIQYLLRYDFFNIKI